MKSVFQPEGQPGTSAENQQPQPQTQQGGQQPPASPTPPANVAPVWWTTSLKELGSSLPCGILGSGGRSRTFRLRPFRMKEERELSKLRDGANSLTFGTFVSEVLSMMIQTVGPHTFDTISAAQRKLVLSQMEMADVLYMYLYLRYEAMGSEEPVVLPIMCPNCHHQFRVDADLGTLEVKVVPDSTADLRRLCKLRDGLVIQGAMRDTVWLAPLKWSVSDSPMFNAGSASIALIVQSSIVGANGVNLNPFIISDPELDEMTKRDIEIISADINNNTPGPVMAVKSDCPKCKNQLVKMLDWGYDSFFSKSSPVIHGSH